MATNAMDRRQFVRIGLGAFLLIALQPATLGNTEMNYISAKSGKDEIKKLQTAINARKRVPAIAVDGTYGTKTQAAEIETARIMGVSPYKGTQAAAVRRQAVIVDQAHRTKVELERAKKIGAQTATPKIIDLGVRPGGFGSLGTLLGTVGHYTAGPRDTSDSHALRLLRSYHEQHKAQGWGGIGYHAAITSAGSLVLLRPFGNKGAHVAAQNTGRLGVVVCGNQGERMTAAQLRTWHWLLRNAHTDKMPKTHRASRRLLDLKVWGHNDLMATSCPGNYKSDYLNKG